MFTNAEEAIAFTRNEGVEFIDVRFIDLPGVMQHFNIPVAQFDEDSFTEGLMFDGSSIRGFQAIHESDMKLVPDVKTAFIDPFRKRKTLVMNFSIVDPFTDEPYARDPRNIAAKAEAYLASTGLADTAFFAPEAEFYIFDDVKFGTSSQSGFYSIDSVEAAWNTGRDEEGGNLGYKTRYKGGYFPTSPGDRFADLRDDMVATLGQVGLDVERAHHEVGTAGQQEINYKFNTLLHAADDLMKFKYVIKNVGFEAGKSVTFMPKPIFGDNGSGMHSHQSLWLNGEPLFYDEKGYGGLSDMARWYIGGLLKHAPSLLAFTNPSANSFHRLVPGFEAPVNLVYSARNRSACIRIPITGNSPKAKRVEFRVPDPSSNPYLAFSAMLLAGIDGIKNRIEPPAPVDKDLYELPPEEHAEIAQVPSSLEGTLNSLEADHEFLTQGDVFSEDLIATWIDYKRTNEIDPIRLRPHPHEFELYYDI
ncbi:MULTISPECIES: type I glutamate--ammonia ligase [Isoptericola]|uniref:Glutamine synthetase n=1 Tax=Isoptericola sediminis TaxID=2733572 RepID=A0A849K937_9MICO|nr:MULTISPECIES: type I glutamate--ammonia ligase [Isoptericola]MDO8145245.1 type I glutamate--ammonia ligase [Isoptericola sp. 178]MDO8148883.1 type I glutamate--ammonia ligase [Isoptericola sp. b515]MDO8151175.1 type I glutamate--ammonia ligase [Isoptericola sp. b408]NNU28519.1 type I glutamate--ammonia ligase [Isoptericola sediminis]